MTTCEQPKRSIDTGVALRGPCSMGESSCIPRSAALCPCAAAPATTADSANSDSQVMLRSNFSRRVVPEEEETRRCRR